MSSPNRHGPRPISEILGDLFAARGFGRLRAGKELEDAWNAAVGEPGCRQTRVGEVRRGVLNVTVASSALLEELAAFRKPALLAALRQDAPGTLIHDIRFRVGPIGPPAPRDAPRPGRDEGPAAPRRTMTRRARRRRHGCDVAPGPRPRPGGFHPLVSPRCPPRRGLPGRARPRPLSPRIWHDRGEPAMDLSKTDGTAMTTPGSPGDVPGDGEGAPASSAYTEANIRVLEGIEAIRLRPGMYIGDTTPRGLAPPGLRGRGQLDRRGDGRPLPAHPRDDPRRRLGLDRRRRPGHPGRRRTTSSPTRARSRSS